MNSMVQYYTATYPIQSIMIIKKYVSDIYLLISSPAAAHISNLYMPLSRYSVVGTATIGTVWLFSVCKGTMGLFTPAFLFFEVFKWVKMIKMIILV